MQIARRWHCFFTLSERVAKSHLTFTLTLALDLSLLEFLSILSILPILTADICIAQWPVPERLATFFQISRELSDFLASFERVLSSVKNYLFNCRFFLTISGIYRLKAARFKLCIIII